MQKKWILVVFCSLFINIGCFGDKFSNIDSMYYWFYCRQGPEGLVVAEDKDNFTVEEEAISVIIFLARGHTHRAERILDFFNNLQNDVSKTGKFTGFYRYYQINGQPLSSEILTSTQLWLLVAINEYTIRTGNKKYLPLAQSLCKIVLDTEGEEKGIAAGYWGTTPLAYFTSSDNLMAVSVFSKLWHWSNLSEYRFAAWRTYQFINRFLWDEKQKNFRRRIYQPEFDITDSFWAVLVLGADYTGWKSFEEPTDLYNKILLAFVYSEYKNKDKNETILKDVEKNLLWSKKYWGAAGLPAVEGGAAIDIFATAWYLMAMEDINPLSTNPDFWKNKVMIPPSERQFKGDDFEQGNIQVLLAYAALIEENNCRVVVEKNSEADNIKAGTGSLRVFFSPIEKSTKSGAVITREFLEHQDFAGFSNVKVWMNASTASRIFQSRLEVKIGFVDSDKELWLSPNLSVIGKKGFINSYPFPVGWVRDTGGLKGNNIFDVEGVRAFKIVISQTDDTPWQLYFDDLILQ